MTGRDPSTEDDHQGTREGPLRLRPLRVLVVSPDERFRAVGAMLIARRGCEIFTALPEAAEIPAAASRPGGHRRARGRG